MGFQIKDKKGFQLKSGLFAMIVVSGLLIATFNIILTWNDFYGVNLDNDLISLSKLDELTAEAESQQQKISPEVVDPGSDFEGSTFRGVFGIITTIMDSFGIILSSAGWLGEIGDRFGIPVWAIQVPALLITFSIIFAIISVIFRRNST